MLKRRPDLDTQNGRRVLGVGAIVAGILIVAYASFQPNPFRDSRSIYVRFDSVQGLGSIDRNVRVAGANVGLIGDVQRQGDDVVVELELEPEIEVHNDATAELRPHTLFEGSAFVDLTLGSPSAPDLAEGEHIPLARTSVYVSLDTATRIFRKPNRDALDGLNHAGSQILRDEGIEGLRELFGHSPELLEELGPNSRALRGPEGDELRGAIAGIARTLDALAAEEAALVPLADRGERTLGALLVNGGASLEAALAALPAPIEQLAEGGDELAALAERLDRLSAELVPVATELAPLLSDSQPLLIKATPIIEDTVPFVRDLGTILASVADAGPAALALIEALAPGAEIFAESVLPFQNSDTRIGAPLYTQLLAAFTGATASLAPYETIAQNPLGAGHVLRLSAYFDPGGTVAGLFPGCAVIAEISPTAAAQLEEAGLCSP